MLRRSKIECFLNADLNSTGVNECYRDVTPNNVFWDFALRTLLLTNSESTVLHWRDQANQEWLRVANRL